MKSPGLLLALLALALPAEAATCKGEDPCKACRDCSRCAHCSPKNPQPGSCGVLRDQTPAQAAARLRKQRLTAPPR